MLLGERDSAAKEELCKYVSTCYVDEVCIATVEAKRVEAGRLVRASAKEIIESDDEERKGNGGRELILMLIRNCSHREPRFI